MATAVRPMLKSGLRNHGTIDAARKRHGTAFQRSNQIDETLGSFRRRQSVRVVGNGIRPSFGWGLVIASIIALVGHAGQIFRGLDFSKAPPYNGSSSEIYRVALC